VSHEVYASLALLRGTLKGLEASKKTLTLHVMKAMERQGMGGVSAAQIAKYCPVKVINDLSFEIQKCHLQTSVDMIMDNNDFYAAALIVGGYMSYLSPALAYNPTGAIAIAQILNNEEGYTNKRFHDLLRANPKLLTIQDRTIMKNIMLPVGAEALEGYRIAHDNQKEFCASGRAQVSKGEKPNRPGHIFSFGFCVNDREYYDTQRFVTALQWPSYFEFTGYEYSYSNGIQTEIKRTKWTKVSLKPLVEGEIADVKALLPNKYDVCGNAVDIPDATLGGIFPEGDYVQSSRVSDTNFLKPRCKVK
jgi:hypothetical protein